jgi:protein-export membrane protein SecD
MGGCKEGLPSSRTGSGRGAASRWADDREEANDLALVPAGALPVPLKVVEQGSVGPTLGADSIRDGLRAPVLAVAFVFVVMGLYYKFAGVLATSALLFYVLFALGGLALFGFTLTLPGLAGFALSIGMAVDANVLIFERIRDEQAAGATVRASVDPVQARVSAIIDSNVTTPHGASCTWWAPIRSGFAIASDRSPRHVVSAVFVPAPSIWLGAAGSERSGSGASDCWCGVVRRDRARKWAYRLTRFRCRD